MWDLKISPYELIFRAVAVFSFIFIVFRFWGKKHFGQLSPFDFILLLIISESVQNALVSNDQSLLAAFITISTLMLLTVILNRITFYSKRAESIIDGTPKAIVFKGKINEFLLRKEKITESELFEALREHGASELSDVQLATLETNGTISVVRKQDESIFTKFFH
jgi:uncharacterized membrane protein YcaP (DUF421 family)